MKPRSISKWCIALLIANTASHLALARTCEMQTYMQAAQQQEQQRLLRQLEMQFQPLQRLYALERACLDNFPAYPTQWLGNSELLTEAFNRIKREFCQALIDKARQTPQPIPLTQQATSPQTPSAKSNFSSNSALPPKPGTFTNSSDTENSPRQRSGVMNHLMRLFQ